jgi:hypothetical protein
LLISSGGKIASAFVLIIISPLAASKPTCVDGHGYVSKTHQKEGLKLRGLAYAERAIEYIDAYIETIELDEAVRMRLAEKFRWLAMVLGNGKTQTER